MSGFDALARIPKAGQTADSPAPLAGHSNRTARRLWMAAALIATGALAWRVTATSAARGADRIKIERLVDRSVRLFRAVTARTDQLQVFASEPVTLNFMGPHPRVFEVECLDSGARFVGRITFELEAGSLLNIHAAPLRARGRNLSRRAAIRAARQWAQTLDLAESERLKAEPSAWCEAGIWVIAWPRRPATVTVRVNSVSGALISAEHYSSCK